MDDLGERLRQIETNPSPDLWTEITSRSSEPPAPEPEPDLRRRLAVGLVATLIAVGAFAFLLGMFRTEPKPPVATTMTPLRIRVWTTQSPYESHFTASFGGAQIPLDPIETPGSELEYPQTVSPVALPVGTPIVMESDAETVSVFQLDRATGEIFGEGSCIVPGALRALPGPGPAAFFIFAEWPDASAGMGFQAEMVGGDLDHEGARDPNADVDATTLGLASCETVPPASAPSTERIALYASLLRVVATQGVSPLVGPIYVQRGICYEGPPNGIGSDEGCSGSFSEVEQAELRQRLASLGDLRFVGSFADVGIGQDGSNPEAAIFVWVGPIEHHGDKLRAGGGMWCGGLCGQGGTFELGPGQDRWELSYCCVSWIQ